MRRWDFDFLGKLRPELPIELVRGDRESAATHFTRSTLGAYMQHLAQGDSGEVPLYLKEFNLLRRFPHLDADISPRKRLFPRRVVAPPPGVWVGPAGAHRRALRPARKYRHTDPRRKRFRIAPPGFVEGAGALSAKYDPWARLSAVPLSDIAAASNYAESLYEVDLAAYDALYVPDHWWHEVHNRSASILLSGFFGTYRHVTLCAIRVAARQLSHLAHLDRATACTCHESTG